MSKKIYKESIKNWPEDEKPREKLLRNGEHTLSDTELLAILLRSGTKGKSAIDLAREMLREFKTFRDMSHSDIRKWKEIRGLGDAKICQIKAALEIGRRFREVEARKERKKIKSSEEIVNIFMPRMRDLNTELFKVLCLDSRNRIIKDIEIEEGTVNQANPIIREIFQKASSNFSSSVICMHNHPSGDPSPSEEDKEFTKTLVKAGEILNIKVLDHIIFGDNTYFSFADKNLF